MDSGAENSAHKASNDWRKPVPSIRTSHRVSLRDSIAGVPGHGVVLEWDEAELDIDSEEN